ncbi:MAG: hypothetical protein QOD75_1214 [Blastocatellia bacterium]|jgi:hypothetical protein|nr:hypothetical protein [Blastocatellia bacterium]
MGETTLVPATVKVRAYQVGFGDAFLLTFEYPEAEQESDRERHVLIDFGSTGMPKGVDSSEQMMKVAEDIRKRCGPKLHMIVASHRHKDHISGFATNRAGTATGDIIASLNPDIVVQPWTEEPQAQDPPAGDLPVPEPSPAQKATKEYLSSLDNMNARAGVAHAEATYLTSAKFRMPLEEDLADQITFLSEDNVPNKLAVANLVRMGARPGAKNHYVSYGYKLDLTELLPGVTARFLGPPSLEQHAAIRKERSEDENEFWMLHAATHGFWHLQAATGELIRDLTADNSQLFPEANTYEDYFPSHDRWFIRQLRTLRGEQLQGLVRILDKSMNNTSVILLLEAGGKKLLFPGDAQIENWEYALKTDDNLKLLKDVHLYKVGHHGSRNATPKTLWKNFAGKGAKDSTDDRLKTVISTMKGKHGHSKSQTEVPRTTLANELTTLSDCTSTEIAAENGELYVEIEVTLNPGK